MVVGCDIALSGYYTTGGFLVQYGKLFTDIGYNSNLSFPQTPCTSTSTTARSN